MPFVLFAATVISDNSFRMIEAAASLPDVQLGVVTQDPTDSLRHLQTTVAHWRVSDVLSVDQLLWAARELGSRNGAV